MSGRVIKLEFSDFFYIFTGCYHTKKNFAYSYAYFVANFSLDSANGNAFRISQARRNRLQIFDCTFRFRVHTLHFGSIFSRKLSN